MFLKSYSGKYGLHPVITKDNSTLKMLEISMLRLRPCQTLPVCEPGKDTAVVILSGNCSITGEDFAYSGIGSRQSVFEGAAACVFLPKDTAATVTAHTELRAMLCYSPAETKFAPKYIAPQAAVVKQLGKGGWKREAHFNLDERTDANLLYIGEAFVEGGMWASYPPHKHDEDRMPTEGILEEVYYYEFDRPQGFGIQRVYSKDGKIDETYTVKTGDFVEIPKGYHPYACAPGYRGYYLWVMAGKNRGFYLTTEEAHKWLVE